MADNIQIMDFAADDAAPVFYVGPENMFQCVPDIPLSLMQSMAKFKDIRRKLEETGDLSIVTDIFDQLLDERSAALFRERIEDRTIGIKRVMRILPWVMEEFGIGHPTQPSSPSSDGSSDDGTGATSVDGASVNASSSNDSEPTTPSI